uniref:Uncharacterized protein LOC104248266 n=1 Tax=Nicotiana sylvestris TaxID=4096 RepID=A0A1U7YUA6_NICSY|nr:PREDICTED: uncharacterized protein LOC104248266 [Nicotiana sylvestris]
MDDRDVNFVRHVLGELCPNGVKVYSGTAERPLSINCSCMLELARAWGRFVSSRLIPYLNTSNYNIERVLLIYAIMHELPVNVGRLISNAMVSCRIKSDCECLYFPSTITRLASLFDVDLNGLQKTENSYFIGSDFLHSLRPPTGPTQVEQEQMLVDSGNEAENEPEQPLNSEIGTTPTILVPNILVSIQELLQRQTELMNSWEIFRSEQVVREAVFAAHVEHILRELTEARNTHNLICQTLQNQFAYTSPIIYTIGTVMCNIANTMRSYDIPSFFPHLLF